MMRRAGYSLFEVLVAFAIMSMVLATLLPRQSALLARARSVEDRVHATQVALSHLAALGVTAPLEPGEARHNARGWTLVQDVTPYPLPDDTSAPDLLRVRVQVQDARGTVLATLSELRVAP